MTRRVSWYLLVRTNIRQKIKVTQNKFIRFSLKLNSRHYIGAKEFKKINWLPTKERVEQPVTTNIFKYWKGNSLLYVNKLFVPSKNVYKTRSHIALEIKVKMLLRKSRSKERFIYDAIYLE